MGSTFYIDGVCGVYGVWGLLNYYKGFKAQKLGATFYMAGVYGV